MQKFLIRSVISTEMYDIVEAESIDDAKQKVLSGGNVGPIFCGDDTTEIRSVIAVDTFVDFVKSIHPTASPETILKLINSNVLK